MNTSERRIYIKPFASWLREGKLVNRSQVTFEVLQVALLCSWVCNFQPVIILGSRNAMGTDHTDHWLLRVPCFDLHTSCYRRKKKKSMALLKRTFSPWCCSETLNAVSVYDHCILRCQYYSVMRLLFLHESRHCSPTSCCDIKRCFLSRRHCISNCLSSLIFTSKWHTCKCF